MGMEVQRVVLVEKKKGFSVLIRGAGYGRRNIKQNVCFYV